MRKTILVAFTVAALLPAASALATVNCNVVNRELRLGKWPEDVALGMGVTLAEVRQCKEQPGKVPPGQAKKDDATPPGHTMTPPGHSKRQAD